MALDQATQALLAQLAEQAADGPPWHELSPAQARAQSGRLKELVGEGPEMARVENRTLQAADGSDFTVRALVPVAEPRGVVVYNHGGGWVLSDIDNFDALGRRLAARTGCTVVLVDYRKAPEHPYPAAVEDAWQALNWADAHLTELAGRRVPLIVAGDSAGGNLSAVVARRARDAGGPDLALQVLVYPVTDSGLDTASYREPANQLMLRAETMAWFWDHYAEPGRREEPDASPLRTPDLAGLPAALVVLAEHDVLRDEGEAYAKALAAAGVSVQQHLCPGQMHGFFSMGDLLPGSADGLGLVVDAIDRALTTAPAPATEK